VLGAGLALAAGPAFVHSEVFHSKDEALALAFAEGTSVESQSVVLTDAQVARVKELGGIAPESKLFTYYRGRRDGALVGYAVIDTHTVRSLPEAILAVLRPDGAVDRVILLAFYEPPEYRPPERWLKQFPGRRLDTDGWRVGRDLHGISGATLTAHAIRDALRKITALHAVVMRPESGA
jgi:hypothetical protein